MTRHPTVPTVEEIFGWTARVDEPTPIFDELFAELASATDHPLRDSASWVYLETPFHQQWKASRHADEPRRDADSTE